MAHYAKVLDGKVVEVIVADEDFFEKFVDNSPGTWIQTSFNTRGGVHYDPETGLPSGKVQLRYNFAGVGGNYDSVADAFYSERPYPSWKLNKQTYVWEAPVPRDNEENIYWDETSQSWTNQML